MKNVERNSNAMSQLVSAGNNFLAGSQKFPGDLSADDSVVIGIYDSSQSDAINKMSDGVSKVSDMMKQAFGDGGSGGSGGMMMGGAQLESLANIAKSKEAMDTSPGKGKGITLPDMGIGASPTIDIGNGGLPAVFKGTITLPLPNNLQESLSHQYDEQGGWVEDLDAIAGGHGKNLIDNFAKLGAIYAKNTGSRSFTFDRNRIAMYTSTAFRSVTLSWTLIPNNADDTETIQKIVMDFKKFSSPQSVAKKLLLRSPHYFRIKFPNKIIDKALQFYEVVCTDISVQYNPGGSMEMTHDNAPKSIELSVTFKDREPKLYEDWDQGIKAPAAPGQTKCAG